MNYLRNIYEDLRLVSNSICGKLVSLLELLIIFNDSLKVTSVSFFVAYFNLFRCDPDTFTFTLLHGVILY